VNGRCIQVNGVLHTHTLVTSKVEIASLQTPPHNLQHAVSCLCTPYAHTAHPYCTRHQHTLFLLTPAPPLLLK